MHQLQSKITTEASRPDEKDVPMGSGQDGCTEKTEHHILWTDPLGRQISTVKESSNTPSSGHNKVKNYLGPQDCHRHVDDSKKYIEA